MEKTILDGEELLDIKTLKTEHFRGRDTVHMPPVGRSSSMDFFKHFK